MRGLKWQAVILQIIQPVKPSLKYPCRRPHIDRGVRGCLPPHLRRVEDELPDAVIGQPVDAEAGKGSLVPLPASD